MPIFMDRHDVSDSVTAELIAELHQQDLKVQDQFGCRGLTYWFDDQRKMAFCLIEAPHKDAIREMHDFAHGKVPHQVIEVEAGIVESFLGRIGDPVKAQNVELNIINDPAFRAIMVINLKPVTLSEVHLAAYQSAVLRFGQSIPGVLKAFGGSLVKQSKDHYLISFQSVSNAVHASLEIRGLADDHVVKIGLSTGVPVTEKNLLFEDAIRLAERLALAGKSNIVVSAEVRELYDSENPGSISGKKGICCLTPADEQFITKLMVHAENNWLDSELKVDDLNRVVGYSKPQLYRKMIQLTGKSPLSFINDYRLDEGLSLLNKGASNVSQIAYELGFSSPSYFTKCFQKRYGRSPSGYLAAQAND